MEAADWMAEFDQCLDFCQAGELKLVVVAGLTVAARRRQAVTALPCAQTLRADTSQLCYRTDAIQALVFHWTHDLYKGERIVQE